MLEPRPAGCARDAATKSIRTAAPSAAPCAGWSPAEDEEGEAPALRGGLVGADAADARSSGPYPPPGAASGCPRSPHAGAMPRCFGGALGARCGAANSALMLSEWPVNTGTRDARARDAAVRALGGSGGSRRGASSSSVSPRPPSTREPAKAGHTERDRRDVLLRSRDVTSGEPSRTEPQGILRQDRGDLTERASSRAGEARARHGLVGAHDEALQATPRRRAPWHGHGRHRRAVGVRDDALERPSSRACGFTSLTTRRTWGSICQALELSNTGNPRRRRSAAPAHGCIVAPALKMGDAEAERVGGRDVLDDDRRAAELEGGVPAEPRSEANR